MMIYYQDATAPPEYILAEWDELLYVRQCAIRDNRAIARVEMTRDDEILLTKNLRHHMTVQQIEHPTIVGIPYTIVDAHHAH